MPKIINSKGKDCQETFSFTCHFVQEWSNQWVSSLRSIENCNYFSLISCLKIVSQHLREENC
jgi:hypothetical protein